MKGLKALFLLLTVALLCVGCEGTCGKKKNQKYDKVLILYQPGFNSLGDALLGDIDELKRGDLPTQGDDKAIVIVGHHTVSYLNFETHTQPCVIRLYKDKKGTAVLDTLLRLGDTELLTQKEVMSRTLNYVAETFKSDHYGLILGSHGSGWLPADYYDHPERYKSAAATSGMKTAPHFVFPTGPVPYAEPEPLPGPKVRSFGQEILKEGGRQMSSEMDIKDLHDALPFRFDYILMDACLMGCVEVAYEMRDKCKLLGFSPTEILSEGLVYTQIAARLLKNGDPDIRGVMDDYYDCYAAQSGDYRSACFSLIDCTQLEPLASACRDAFASGRAAIASVNPKSVQRYYRGSHHWFYDLKDILDQAGVPSQAVEAALNQCVLHTVHTESFFPHSSDGFVFRVFCGMSMYLPCNGTAYLDAYYKTLSWNKATSLVQ